MPNKVANDHSDSYRRASERLIVLLSASRHQIDIMEDKEKRLQRLLPAILNVAKAFDLTIQRLLGVSPRSLAHIVPREVTTIDPQQVTDAKPEALLVMTAAYDARFAVAERQAYLRRPKESLGSAYRYVRGSVLHFAGMLLRVYRGRHRG